MIELTSTHTEQVCITCSDEAFPGEVVELPDGPLGLALVDYPGRGRERVDVSLVPPVAIGDIVLVHARTAISRLTGETGR